MTKNAIGEANRIVDNNNSGLERDVENSFSNSNQGDLAPLVNDQRSQRNGIVRLGSLVRADTYINKVNPANVIVKSG